MPIEPMKVPTPTPGWTLQVTCGECAGPLAPLAPGRGTSSELNTIVRCNDCGREWLIHIRMTGMRTQAADRKARSRSAAAAREAAPT